MNPKLKAGLIFTAIFVAGMLLLVMPASFAALLELAGWVLAGLLLLLGLGYAASRLDSWGRAQLPIEQQPKELELVELPPRCTAPGASEAAPELTPAAHVRSYLYERRASSLVAEPALSWVEEVEQIITEAGALEGAELELLLAHLEEHGEPESWERPCRLMFIAGMSQNKAYNHVLPALKKRGNPAGRGFTSTQYSRLQEIYNEVNRAAAAS